VSEEGTTNELQRGHVQSHNAGELNQILQIIAMRRVAKLRSNL